MERDGLKNKQSVNYSKKNMDDKILKCKQGNKFVDSFTIKNSIIIYFDILGYKEHLSKYGNNFYLHIINQVVEKVLQEIESLGYEWDLSEFCMDENNNFRRKFKAVNYRIFSDNFVFAIALFNEKEKNYMLLRTIISYIYKLQQELIINYNIFIRGSIVCGEILFSDNYIFGDGLVKAYSLENEMAVVPRIILDKEVVNIFNMKVDDIIHDLYKVTDEEVIEDIDGIFFINYLAIDNRYIEGLGDDEITRNAVMRHRQIIEENIQTCKTMKTIQKYFWCKEFHNRICKKYDYLDFLLV